MPQIDPLLDLTMKKYYWDSEGRRHMRTLADIEREESSKSGVDRAMEVIRRAAANATTYKLDLKKPPQWLTQNNFYYESFLAMRYLVKNNFKFTSDIFKDSIAMYKKYIIIVDSTTINQNWFKRNPVWSGNSVVKSGYNLPPNSLIEISHADWLAFKLGSHTLRPDKLAARH
jgi:hypothetical protein